MHACLSARKTKIHVKSVLLHRLFGDDQKYTDVVSDVNTLIPPHPLSSSLSPPSHPCPLAISSSLTPLTVLSQG